MAVECPRTVGLPVRAGRARRRARVVEVAAYPATGRRVPATGRRVPRA